MVILLFRGTLTSGFQKAAIPELIKFRLNIGFPRFISPIEIVQHNPVEFTAISVFQLSGTTTCKCIYFRV
jgi:hypothetical protein